MRLFFLCFVVWLWRDLITPFSPVSLPLCPFGALNPVVSSIVFVPVCFPGNVLAFSWLPRLPPLPLSRPAGLLLLMLPFCCAGIVFKTSVFFLLDFSFFRFLFALSSTFLLPCSVLFCCFFASMLL